MTIHNTTNLKTGLILLAHGSRDPAWSQGIEAIAHALSTPTQPAKCAYVELSSPDLLQVVSNLADLHCQRIEIIPMFLGLGQHARHDLPSLLAQAQLVWPKLALNMQAALCDRPQFIETITTLLKSHEG